MLWYTGTELNLDGVGGDVGVCERKEVSKGIPEGNTAELMIMTHSHLILTSPSGSKKVKIFKSRSDV